MSVKYNWKNMAVTAGCLGFMASGMLLCGFTRDAEPAHYDQQSGRPVVWYTSRISPDAVVFIYNCVNKELSGNVAVKVHSGEAGNQNYLRPEFMKPIVERVHGTVVECNTAYGGERNSTEKHEKLMKKHGWSEVFDVDILDDQGPDMVLPVFNGKWLKCNYVGRDLAKYDSMLVVSHFKGHPMGGYGGALKQLSIGCASSAGKSWIHSAGKTLDQTKVWNMLPEKNEYFLESMAESADSVVSYFRGNMAFINIMCNMSVDCDCCAKAEDPCIKDIGILGSVDPVALDRACMDLIYASKDPGREHFLERVRSRHGEHTIDAAAERGVGEKEYKLINTDNAKG